MSDFEIEFGDVEESLPDKALRPDEDGRYAVALYGEPAENDLVVYIDLDVLRDMEEHALTDTTVELGGVMLGGQRHDADGNPFVVVEESLRARHYEATKGSFKFTHDTWERISRDREAFPEDLAMVGWYHTHPDWGVFLSGMDMFICDNFFNRPLDVALVIDPCRQDRGWFYWTGTSDRIRRAGGFVVYASRHRRDELESFVRSLEEEGAMPATRYPQIAESTRGSSPVVVVPESRSAGWQGPFLATAICVQTLALVLFAYAAIGGGMGGAEKTELDEETLVRLSRIEERLLDAEEARKQSRASEIELRIAQAKLELVDRFAAGEVGAADLATRTATAEETVRQLEDTLDAFRAERSQMEATIGSLTGELTKTQIARKSLVEQIAALREERDAARASLAKYEKPKKTEKEGDGAEAEQAGLLAWAQQNYLWLTVSIVAALALVGGTVALLQYRGEASEDEAGRRRDEEGDSAGDRSDSSPRSPFEG